MGGLLDALLYQNGQLNPQQPQATASSWNLAQNFSPPIFAPRQEDAIHTIAPGPEYNKWDEALREHGRILLPKELDNPQTWLNAPHLERFLQDYHREDRPDGSVVLSRIVPMS